jgi:hypothetical protein
VHLFGNSLGGAVSTRVAADRPTSSDADARVAGPAEPAADEGQRPALPLLLLPGLARLAERRLGRPHARAAARGVLELCYGDPSTIPPQRMAEAVQEMARRGAAPLPGRVHRLAARADPLLPRPRRPLAVGRGGRVQAPTLLVWGDRDRLVDVAIAPRRRAPTPTCRLLVLPGVGHVAQMERPETVAGPSSACSRSSAPGRARERPGAGGTERRELGAGSRDAGPGCRVGPHAALLSRAAEEQLHEQRQVSAVLGELRALLQDVDGRAATGVQVERVAAGLRELSARVEARLDAAQARADELAQEVRQATTAVGQVVQEVTSCSRAPSAGSPRTSTTPSWPWPRSCCGGVVRRPRRPSPTERDEAAPAGTASPESRCYLKTSLTFSPACLRLPVAWSL